MKTLLFGILGVIAQGCASHLNLGASEWLEFKSTHKKAYSDVHEESERMRIYHENKKNIEAHNELYEKGIVSYSLKMNEFGDLHPREFRARFNRFNVAQVSGIVKRERRHILAENASTVPDAVDWRQENAVTEVKNQGSCGSCWAFSTTGSVEGQWKIKTGELLSLSEQFLVDCSTNDDNEGCNGGLMTSAFEYIVNEGGIVSESSYPYKGYSGECHLNNVTFVANISGYTNVNSDEDDLKDAVARIGPVSVGMDASGFTFQFYFKGVYDPWFCSNSSLDHGVLVVGYGQQNDKDFWLVKNSWGASWGESGYFKIVRNKGNKCGLATIASYPLVD